MGGGSGWRLRQRERGLRREGLGVGQEVGAAEGTAASGGSRGAGSLPWPDALPAWGHCLGLRPSGRWAEAPFPVPFPSLNA